MRKAIILVGFMGCGKSSIARKIGKKLSMEVVDIDMEIEKESGETITQIFESKGETHFRQLETAFLNKHDLQNKIVATGGGMPCFNDNIEKLKTLGTVIYLKTSPKETLRRLTKSKHKRPLLSKFSNERDLLKYIEETILVREYFYKQANLIISADDESKEVIVERILKSLSQSNV
jgi:shikimate kinase